MGSSLISALRRPFERLSKSRLADESGWLIVEIMIGSVVLVLGALAIYNGLDGASKTSGKNRNRTEASILAQQDQERMRTMDATALSNYSRVATVKVGNLSYVVTSKASYVSDTSGAVSCTNSSTTAQYLKISSSVADPTSQNQPVVEDSLLSPKPADGGAAVQIVDRNGAGVSNLPVTLAEPPSTTINTDAQGCSLFGFLDSSTDYGVTFSKTGYVDPSGTNQFTDAPITQVPGSTTLTQFQYDLAGTVTANVVTSPTGKPVNGTKVSAFNSHIPGAQFRTFDLTSGSATANNLFPFTDPYTFYAGACSVDKPPATSTKIATATVAPGGSSTVTVTEPVVSLTVKRSGSPAAGAKVWFTSTDDPSCVETYGPFVTSSTTPVSGAIAQGLPYGDYAVCGSTSGGGRWGSGDVDNTGDSGVNFGTLNIDNSSKDTTRCP
jgi:Tfp pilus assembly protein PilV